MFQRAITCVRRVPVCKSRRMYATQPFEWQNREWSRLVRFKTPEGETHYGEAQVSGDGTPKLARVIEEKTGKVTTKELRIGHLLSPLQPLAIICIGLNYQKHAAESKLPTPQFPVVFTKNVSAVQNPNGPIIIPKICRDPPEVDYESELAVVIGKPAKNVSAASALDYVLGYTCANDVSARLWQTQRGGSQWCFAKSFDTFCPLGPMLVSPSVIPNPNKLKISTVLNGKVVQDSNTEDMIFDVPRIIEFLSQSTTLVPGTVILTGTPSGVGMARKPPLWLAPGDKVTIEIENIGKLTNDVKSE